VSVEPSVVVVIPTFAPPGQLPSLVSAIRESGYPIVVSDDASPCTSDAVLREVASIPNVDVLRHAGNAGIARGLNEGLAVAQLAEAHWILTVDQDSMIATNYLPELLDSASSRLEGGEPLGAIGAEMIEDASGPMTYPLSAAHPNATTQEIIQTGTLWNAAAMHQVGGFDESMGMDAVDAAACLALRRAGFTIGVAQGLSVGSLDRSQSGRAVGPADGDGYRAFAGSTCLDVAQSHSAPPRGIRRITTSCLADHPAGSREPDLGVGPRGTALGEGEGHRSRTTPTQDSLACLS